MRAYPIIFTILAMPTSIFAQDALPQKTISAPLSHPDLGRSSPFTETKDELKHGVSNKAIIRTASIWPKSADGRTRIRVCWIDPRPEHSKQREITKDAVLNTWGLLSSIDFLGWDTCDGGASEEIRIVVGDEWPRSLVGYQGGRRPTTMYLNFEFRAPSEWTFCSSTKNQCIYKLAVHEFGHAIGFVHEQERPETPDACLQQTGETPLPSTKGYTTGGTPYDPDSVMNYCNPVWNNAGHLSKLDVLALQTVYNSPRR